MSLTFDRIRELAVGEGVRKIAVENFLGTLAGSTEDEALSNLVLDAKSYRWNAVTVRTIQAGIREHFRGR